MLVSLLIRLQAWVLFPDGGKHNLLQLLDDWSDDAFDFLRTRVPRIVAVLIIAFILTRLLRKLSRHLSNLSNREGLPSALRAQLAAKIQETYGISRREAEKQVWDWGKSVERTQKKIA